MQHFRVKFFARPTPPDFDIGKAIPVFHRWIQTGALPGTLIDVADYQHVPAGPGILLVSYDAYYGLDQAKHRLGLLYTRRTTMGASAADQVRDAVQAALHACDLLEREPEFAGKLTFDRDHFELSVNDRMLAPNTPESFEQLSQELAPLNYSLKSIGAPRELLTVAVSR